MAKRRPQGEGTIRKRPDGRGEGRIIIGHKKDGTRIYKSVFGKTQKSTLTQMHKLIDLFAPNLILGISDEISSTGDIERIRLVGKIVDEYNAKIDAQNANNDAE